MYSVMDEISFKQAQGECQKLPIMASTVPEIGNIKTEFTGDVLVGHAHVLVLFFRRNFRQKVDEFRQF